MPSLPRLPVMYSNKSLAFATANFIPRSRQVSFLSVSRSRHSKHIVTCATGTKKPHSGTGIRPKQSLGQNFLRDRNVVSRIVNTFEQVHSSQHPDSHVVEVGPGLGALTTELVHSVPNFHAIEIDQRAVAHLRETFPSLSVEHANVLDTDWQLLSEKLGAPLSVIGNLPYNIVSQILLSLLESPEHSVRFAMVMMQREVAHRIVAKTRTKAYGILSVVSQLYAKPKVLFSVPPTAFYPVPQVMSEIVQLDFVPHSEFDAKNTALTKGLRVVLKNAFGQRRKVLRNSLKTVCEAQQESIPAKWEDKRAEELSPLEFVELTQVLFRAELKNYESRVTGEPTTKTSVWR